MAKIKFGFRGYSVQPPLVGVSGLLSAQEVGQDSFSAAFSVEIPVSLSMAAQETGQDTLAMSVAAGRALSMAAQEAGQDTASVALQLERLVQMAAQEAGQDSFQANIIATPQITNIETSITGFTIPISFDSSMDWTPDIADIEVREDGIAASIDSVTFTPGDTFAVINMTSALSAGTTIDFSYDGTGDLRRQSDGALLQSVSQIPVTNLVGSSSITFDAGTYTRPADGNNPTISNTNIVTTNTTAPYFLDILTVTNGTAPTQTDMDNGSGTGVLEKVTLGSQANIEDLDGDIDLSTSITTGRIYAQYRDSAGTPVKSALTSIPVADAITYDAVAPVFSSAEIGNVDATSLIITLDKSVFDPGGALPATDFDVQVNAAGVSESAVSVSGSTVDVTVPAVSNGDTVTVAYNGTALVGVDGEQVATFTAQAVTNNVSAGGFSYSNTSNPTFINSGGPGGDITFAAQPIGTAAADREVYVGVTLRRASAPSLNGVTIGGVSANLISTQVVETSAVVAWYKLTVATGTTADIVLQITGNNYTNAMISVYEAKGRTQEGTAQGSVTGSSPVSADINTFAGGVVLAAVCMGGGSSGDITETGFVSDNEQQGDNQADFSIGRADTPSAETPRTMSAAHNGSISGGFAMMTLAIA